MSATMEMPRYVSHKQVWALKLKARALSGEEVVVTPEDERFAPVALSSSSDSGVRVRQGMTSHPVDHGYLVTYQDGFQSWSPTDVFEKGYRPEREPERAA